MSPLAPDTPALAAVGGAAGLARRPMHVALLASLALHALLLSLSLDRPGGDRPVQPVQPVPLRALLLPDATPEPPSQQLSQLGDAGAFPSPVDKTRANVTSATPERAQLTPAESLSAVKVGPPTEAPAAPAAVAVIAVPATPEPVWIRPQPASSPASTPTVTRAAASVASAASSPVVDAMAEPLVDPAALAREVAAQRDAERAKAEAERQEEAARQENLRAEAARAEAARVEAARLESARADATRLEAARAEAARIESAQAARLEAARAAAAQVETARVEAARVEAARVEAARVEAALVEAARVESARVEAARVESARVEAARVEAARAEAARAEAARAEAARQLTAREEAIRAKAAEAAADAARREASRRAMGRQLDAEAAERDAAAAANAARQSGSLPSSWSPLRRVRLFGRTHENTELIAYAEAWVRRIQLNTPVTLVRDLAQRPHAAPLVTVALRSDGSVESVTLVVSSGVPEVDSAVRRIIQDLRPYPPFPETLAREVDVLEIRRSWVFNTGVWLQ